MIPNDDLLITEIEFWREMIDLRHRTASPDSIERMQQALALAELKLRKLDSSIHWRHDA